MDDAADPATTGDAAARTEEPAADLEPRGPRIRPGELRAGVVLVVGWAVVGVLAGLSWTLLAPHIAVVTAAAGPRLVDPTLRGFFTDDLVFLAITAVLGLVGGASAWTLRRFRGPLLFLAVVLGAAACAVITWQVGRLIGLSGYRHDLLHAAAGTSVSRPVALAPHQWVAVQPLLAVLAYVLPTAWSARADLGRGRPDDGALPVAADVPDAAGNPDAAGRSDTEQV